MEALLTSTSSVLEIVLVMALGYVLRVRRLLTDGFRASVSFLVMNVALPASIFVSVLDHLDRSQLPALSGGLLYVAISLALGFAFSWALTRLLRIRPGRRGIFINAVVNANTVFIGLPLNIALFGDESLPYFLTYFIMNTISAWAVGIYFIAADPLPSERKSVPAGFDWRKLLPAPLVGFLVALGWMLLDAPVPEFAHSTLSMIGSMVTPLSLIYIGIVLADAGLRSLRFDADTIWALVGRFVIAPAVMIGILMVAAALGDALPALERNTLIIQSGAPVMAVLPILADRAHGDTRYATNLVTTSTVLFVVVVPVLMAIAEAL